MVIWAGQGAERATEEETGTTVAVPDWPRYLLYIGAVLVMYMAGRQFADGQYIVAGLTALSAYCGAVIGYLLKERDTPAEETGEKETGTDGNE